MLVTFTCKAYADITMFGEVAVSLLKMMGHSGKVPGALSADDVPDALQNLRQALAKLAQEEMPDAGDEDEPPVSLNNRALPLIKLLEAAAAARTHVMWDS